METEKCILSRRSVRRFTDEPVTREELEKLVNVAAYAPSWKNTQISRYIAITDAAEKAYIAENFFSGWAGNVEIVKSASALIVQAFMKNRCGYNRDGTLATERGEGWQYYDCGIAAQTFCLAANDMGLGTVILGIFDREKLQDYLKLPEDREIMALIAIGHSAQGDLVAPKRKTADDLLTVI